MIPPADWPGPARHDLPPDFDAVVPDVDGLQAHGRERILDADQDLMGGDVRRVFLGEEPRAESHLAAADLDHVRRVGLASACSAGDVPADFLRAHEQSLHAGKVLSSGAGWRYDHRRL
jgi:hypothetical protein